MKRSFVSAFEEANNSPDVSTSAILQHVNGRTFIQGVLDMLLKVKLFGCTGEVTGKEREEVLAKENLPTLADLVEYTGDKVLYEAFSEAARAIQEQIDRICTAPKRQKAADSDYTALSELVEQISTYLDGFIGYHPDRTNQEVIEALSWTEEQVEADGLEAKIDGLLEMIKYRIAMRELVTALLEQANIPHPYDRTFKDWDRGVNVWLRHQNTPNHEDDRQYEIWNAVIDANVVPEASPEQGPEWRGDPERYMTAAFYLTNLNIEEIQQKLDMMRALVDNIIGDITQQIQDKGAVPSAVRGILDRMMEKNYTFTVDARNLPKSFIDKYGDFAPNTRLLLPYKPS